MRNILLALLLLSGPVFAQKKMLTVEDAVIRQRTTLAPERLQQIAWIPGTHMFTFIVKNAAGKECVVRQDAEKLTRDTILTSDQYKKLMSTMMPAEQVPSRIPAMSWVDQSGFRIMVDNAFYLLNLEKNVVSIINKLPKEAEDIEFDAGSGKAAFTFQNNILVYDRETWQKAESGNTNKAIDAPMYKEALITRDGRYGLQNGKAVHRNEFGIVKGLFWSPQGNRLAYYKMYEDVVGDYPLVKNNHVPARAENIKYPMAGTPSHIVNVYIYDPSYKAPILVETGNPADQYLTNVCWSPDEEYLFIAVLNRDQNEMKLNKYDGRTGKFIKTLFTETSAKYVEPEHVMLFPQKNNKQFVWFSKRDGYNQLYLYDHNGKVLRQLSTGKKDVTEFVGFNAEGTVAYYIAASEDGLERQCYSVNLASGKITQITKNPGVHSVSVSSDGAYLVDSYSSTTVPRKVTLMKADGTEQAVLLYANNPLADYASCSIRLGKITADDGSTTLNYRMFFPPQFDSTRKYPVLVYLYGGPHAQMVTNSWLGGADMWLYYMAQQGYVVFTLDNRGSGNRGAEFEQATFRKLGSVEKADQLSGVAFLKKQAYVDASRMGIFGWSFGGFMSTTMMTRSDVFKVGVAGGPVIDWRMYEIMYTERYMDTPKDNPEGYKDADLTNYVKDLKGKLLLIHGTDDDVVLWQHSLTYLKKCVDEGVQVDYFVYPGHKHNVLGKDRVHLMQKVADYFKQNL